MLFALSIFLFICRDFNADKDLSEKLSSYHAPDSRVTELSNQSREKNSESPIVHSNSQSTEHYLGKSDVEFEPNCLFENSENNYDLLAKPKSEKKKKKKRDMSPVKGNGIDDMTSDDVDGKCITSEKRNKHLVKRKSNLSALTETPECEKNSECLPSLKSEQHEETEGNADVSYEVSSFQRKKKKKRHHSHEDIDANTLISVAPVYEEDLERRSVELHKKKSKHFIKTEPLEIEDPSLLNALSASHKKKKKKHSQPDAANSPSLFAITTHKDGLSEMPESGSFVTVTSVNGKKKKRQKSDYECDFVKETKVDVGEAGYKIARHKKKGIHEVFVKSEVTEEASDCMVKKAKKQRHAESN